MEKIGKCSLCGGTVFGFVGAYFGKPPPSHCVSCGATSERTPNDVIPMYKGNELGEPNYNRESQQDYFGIKKESK